LEDLTGKTLPENIQIVMLNILVRFYDRYSKVYAINSRKNGEVFQIDPYLSFEVNTSAAEIINLKKQLQEEFDIKLDNCIVNIVIGDG
jgi:hypothetical protein